MYAEGRNLQLGPEGGTWDLGPTYLVPGALEDAVRAPERGKWEGVCMLFGLRAVSRFRRNRSPRRELGSDANVPKIMPAPHVPSSRTEQMSDARPVRASDAMRLIVVNVSANGLDYIFEPTVVEGLCTTRITSHSGELVACVVP